MFPPAPGIFHKKKFLIFMGNIYIEATININIETYINVMIHCGIARTEILEILLTAAASFIF